MSVPSYQTVEEVERHVLNGVANILKMVHITVREAEIDMRAALHESFEKGINKERAVPARSPYVFAKLAIALCGFNVLSAEFEEGRGESATVSMINRACAIYRGTQESKDPEAMHRVIQEAAKASHDFLMRWQAGDPTTAHFLVGSNTLAIGTILFMGATVIHAMQENKK